MRLEIVNKCYIISDYMKVSYNFSLVSLDESESNITRRIAREGENGERAHLGVTHIVRVRSPICDRPTGN